MNAISLFTTTYLLVGLAFTAGLFAYSREQVDLAIDSTANNPEERKLLILFLIPLMVLGWPVILSEFKNRN